MTTALITGASRGLGLALARELARAGWHLVINARGADALEAARVELAAYTQVIAIAGDVTDAAHRQQLARAAATLGGLDAVVNNASILGPSPQPHLLDYPLDVLEDVYRANVIAPLGVLQAVRAQLKPNARILNVSSDAGVEAYPGWGGYGSSKAALEQLTAILAAENPTLRVYQVDPGDMQTQMHQAAYPGEDISDRPLPEASVPGFMALLTGDYPSGRYRTQTMGKNTPTLHEFRVALTVDDFAEALEFYGGGLALPVVEQWDNLAGQGVILELGRSTLELLNRQNTDSVDRIETANKAESGQVRLALHVDDVQRAGDDLIARGAQAVHEIVITPWGDRNRRLQAPDGMQITLFQPKVEGS